MKIGLDKMKIIKTAARLADEKGIANISLKVLATELGIKSPSLYKHFNGGLDELNKQLMLYGWRSLESDITKAAIGKAKDDAIKAMCMLIEILLLNTKVCLKLWNGTICINQRNICRQRKER